MSPEIIGAIGMLVMIVLVVLRVPVALPCWAWDWSVLVL